MKCPNCDNELSQIKTDSSTKGLFVLIDQCKNCGGVWLDQNELYQISEDEVKNVDTIDAAAFNNNAPIRTLKYCPKDGTELKNMSDFNIPKKIYVDQCPTCGGMWLDKGEMTEFKEGVAQEQAEMATEENEGSAVSHDVGETWLSRIGNGLMSDVNNRPDRTDDSPLMLPQSAGDLLKQVPSEHKGEILRDMFDERMKDYSDNQNFAKRVVMVMNILRLISLII